MKNLSRVVATALIGTALTTTSAMAVDVTIDATVDFVPALTLTADQVIDFGTVEFTGVPAGLITLGTDDVVAYGAGLSGDTIGIAGELSMTGNTGATVDVSCDDTGAQVGDGTNTLNLQSTEIIMGQTNGVAAGGGTACAGLGTTPLNHVLTVTATDNIILVGSEIDTSSGTVATNTYTSTLAGNFITVRAVYQ